MVFGDFTKKKLHFLQSIPYALTNLKWILENISLPVKTPSLINVFEQILDSEILNNLNKPSDYKKNNLQITISSFSYKKQIPEDRSGNGGGFVFDCRALPNPGKFDHYKCLNGLDEEVIHFLEKENEVISFLNNVYALVDQSVDKYLSRDFTNLNICFGCTGGQHRSVFCAEQLRKHIEKKFPVLVIVNHVEKKAGL
jgi:RNase adaptor protein for sRNA GlmZ degradation